MDELPRVLVISNTALKRSNSNGLSILNILSAIPADNIASFYIQNTFPDKGAAATHFRLTDSEKIHGFFFSWNNGTVINDADILDSERQIDVQDASVKGKESFFKHDVRDFVWKYGRWNKKKLYAWVDQFKPNVILFMNGRSPFMFGITRDLAKRFNLPVVYFTSEDEYWHPATNFWDRILRKKLKRATLDLNAYVRHVIAFHQKLGKMYEDEFHLPVTVVMPSTSVKPVEKVNKNGNLLYAGNLKPYRYESLIDISKALREVDPRRVIDVYSNDIDDDIRCHLVGYKNIALHEAVSRDELETVRNKASVLLHFESFSQKAKPLIQNAFSSKIADCLALGIPFLTYAPPWCGFVPYFQQHQDSICYIGNAASLTRGLEVVLSDLELRTIMRKSSIQLASHCHNIFINAELTKGLLTNVISEKE